MRQSVARAIFVLASSMVMLVVLTACNGGGLWPLADTETQGQDAYALYGSFVIAEEAAADIVENPATPESVIEAIQTADRAAKPTADVLIEAYSAYSAYETQVEAIEAAGQDVPVTLTQKAAAALAALNNAYANARDPILSLVRMVYELGDDA